MQPRRQRAAAPPRRRRCGAAAAGMAALLCATAPCRGGRPRVVIEGHEDMDMPPNADITVPDSIHFWSDDSFHPALKENDVVVLFIREQYCPDCDQWARLFYESAERLRDQPRIAFGQIDAHDEGEVFAEWHGQEEDLPSILVFRTAETLKYRRKPVQFILNHRIATDLPPFVMRLRGASRRDIASRKDFDRLIDDGAEWSDGLVVGLWKPPGLGQYLGQMTDVIFERLAELERYNLLFGMVATEDEYDYEKLSAGGRHPKPGSPAIVTYETSFQPPKADVYVLKEDRDFREEVKAVRDWLEKQKTKRVGHKYDRATRFMMEDLVVPDNCSSSRKVEGKAYVRMGLVGRSSQSGITLFRYPDTEFVTGEKQHMKGLDRGLPGMCVGMKRLMVLPLSWRDGLPSKYSGQWKIANESNLLLDVHLWHIGETNELPGRIEWETDPAKIEEHRVKAAEKDKAREEAIARGEDPDAQCKAEKAAKEEEERAEPPKPKMKKTKVRVRRNAEGKDEVVEVGSSATADAAAGAKAAAASRDEAEETE